MFKKRTNKSKSEILAQVKHDEKTKRMVTLVKLMWPFVESQASIYDTQTVMQAVAGFIELGVKQKQEALKVGDIKVDLSEEEDSVIKAAVVNVLDLLAQENAMESVILTRKFAETLGQYGSAQFLKNPMSSIKVTDIVN